MLAKTGCSAADDSRSSDRVSCRSDRPPTTAGQASPHGAEPREPPGQRCSSPRGPRRVVASVPRSCARAADPSCARALAGGPEGIGSPRIQMLLKDADRLRYEPLERLRTRLTDGWLRRATTEFPDRTRAAPPEGHAWSSRDGVPPRACRRVWSVLRALSRLTTAHSHPRRARMLPCRAAALARR